MKIMKTKRNISKFFRPILCTNAGIAPLSILVIMATLAITYQSWNYIQDKLHLKENITSYANKLEHFFESVLNYGHETGQLAGEHPEDIKSRDYGLGESLQAGVDVARTVEPGHPGYEVALQIHANLAKNPTPQRGPGAAGIRGQTAACSVSANPNEVHPGDTVTIAATVGQMFSARIGRLDVRAFGSGVDEYLPIPKTGGSAVIYVPESAGEGKVVIYLKGYFAEGGEQACYASAVVTIKEEISGQDEGGNQEQACSDQEQACGNACIPADKVCCDNGRYCNSGETCCGTHCCTAGATCYNDSVCCGSGYVPCDQGCMPEGATCCGQGHWCSAQYPVCCSDRCCPAGTHCCDEGCCRDGGGGECEGQVCGNGCCSAEFPKCCGGHHCCGVDEACCGGGCCAPPATCYDGRVCCDPGTVRCGNACMPSSASCCDAVGHYCLAGTHCCDGGCCQTYAK